MSGRSVFTLGTIGKFCTNDGTERITLIRDAGKSDPCRVVDWRAMAFLLYQKRSWRPALIGDYRHLQPPSRRRWWEIY
jgi:hypothetical protein